MDITMVILFIPAKYVGNGYSKAWDAMPEFAQIAANAMQTNGQNH